MNVNKNRAIRISELLSYHHSTSTPLAYRIAGHVVESDMRFPGLDAFLLAEEKPFGFRRNGAWTYEASVGTLYDGPAWLGNTTRHLRVEDTESGITVFIEGVGQFSVGNDGVDVRILSRAPGVPLDLLSEGVLGLPFIYALAKQDTWTLHGSAAEFSGGLAIFLGESGFGKSTLARYLHGQPKWRRIADDILPVAACNDNFSALPHYPQLKLSPEDQPVVLVPPQLPIEFIYAIAPPDRSTKTAEIRDLTPRQAIAALVSQGVSARAFDRQLLGRHFDFCHALAAVIPVKQLSYPREYTILPELTRLIEQDMQNWT